MIIEELISVFVVGGFGSLFVEYVDRKSDRMMK